MKTIKIKSGTKKEIIKYMRSKVTRKVLDVTNAAKSFGEVGERWQPFTCKKNDRVELESNSIETNVHCFSSFLYQIQILVALEQSYFII